MIIRCICLAKTLLSKIVYHVFYTISDLYIDDLSVGECCRVWKLAMPNPLCIIQNDTITYKMRSYVIQCLSSPIHIFHTRTKILSTHYWCILLRKLQEFFNPILVYISYGWCFHPGSIHGYRSVILTTFCQMHENPHFFHKKDVVLSHSGRHFLYFIHT